MKPIAKRNSRQFALQAIYAWQISKLPEEQIEAQFLTAEPYHDEDYDEAEAPRLRKPATNVNYFKLLFNGTVQYCDIIDLKMKPYLTRPFEDLDPMELALLRLAIYELIYCETVPIKVVLNEAIELGKIFCAEDSYKFVNAVLDKMLPTIRTLTL